MNQHKPAARLRPCRVISLSRVGSDFFGSQARAAVQLRWTYFVDTIEPPLWRMRELEVGGPEQRQLEPTDEVATMAWPLQRIGWQAE